MNNSSPSSGEAGRYGHAQKNLNYFGANLFSGNVLFLLYCTAVLVLILLSCIVRESVWENKRIKMEIDRLLIAISVTGPIIYGIWILINECRTSRIEKIMEDCWNIIGSMAPMIIGLLSRNMSSTNRIMMGGLGVTMMYLQKIVRENRIYKGQFFILVVGNAVMVSIYLVSLINETFEDSYNAVICVVPAIIAIGMVIMDVVEEKKKKNEMSPKMKNLVCTMSWMAGAIAWFLNSSSLKTLMQDSV
ncbi:DUF1686 domain-containing protein [Encephalitozoon hellem]|nr:DUF1686 domain-containing protein [Encephalitozoon hellem]